LVRTKTEVDDLRPLATRRHLIGVLRSLFAASACGVYLLRRAPSSTLRSVLSVPPAPDGFLHHMPCGSVSPHNHVQGFPFRGLATLQSRTGFSPVVALLPFPPPSLPIRRRLQRDGPGSRALLPTVSVTDFEKRLDLSKRHAPLGFSSPPGTGFRTAAAPSRSLRPRPCRTKSPSSMVLGVSTARNPIVLYPDRSTCSRFLA